MPSPVADEEWQITNHYVNLKKAFNDEDFTKALSFAKKILRISKTETAAQECVVSCHVNLGQYDEALEVMKKRNVKMPFEKAYCYYRKGDPRAIDILSNIVEPTTRELEIMAQIYYKNEQYEKCVIVYEKLISTVQDDYIYERLSNYAAAIAMLAASQKKELVTQERVATLGGLDQGHEVLYNRACYHLAVDQLDAASVLLRSSIDICSKEKTDDIDELKEELSILKTQVAYIAHRKNDLLRAKRLYYEALDVESFANLGTANLNVALISVVAANLVACGKIENAQESKRWLKAMTLPASETKLNNVQKEIILFNHCLYFLAGKQIDICRKKLKEMSEKFPNSNLLPILSVAVFLRDKKYNEALDALPDESEDHLLRAQVLLSQGSLSRACSVLAECPLSMKPAVISALVYLYLSFEELESAKMVIKNVLSREDVNASPEYLTSILKGAAGVMIKMKQYDTAVELLEKYFTSTEQRDPSILALLVSISNHVDPSIVKKYINELPSIDSLVSEVDVISLESNAASLYSKYHKKVAKGQVSDVVKKKKRKRKPRLPKNLDNPPDPERWLPKWERSNYRKPRHKKHHDIGKGTQGTAGGSHNLDHSGKPTPSAKVENPSISSPQTSTKKRPDFRKKKTNRRR